MQSEKGAVGRHRVEPGGIVVADGSVVLEVVLEHAGVLPVERGPDVA
jgi:hypothetical protein